MSLSGDGGDELFAGYNRYLYCRMLTERFAYLPRRLRGLMAHGVLVGKQKERKVIFGTFSFFLISALTGILLGIAALV